MVSPSAIHLGEMPLTLNLPYGHATDVERHNLVVKARSAGLVPANELGPEGALAVARDVQRQAFLHYGFPFLG